MKTSSRRDIPLWITTAPHLQPGSPEGRMPWGTRHLKEEGAPRTACGEPAGQWRLFRHVRFDALSAESCQRCAKVMASSRPP